MAFSPFFLLALLLGSLPSHAQRAVPMIVDGVDAEPGFGDVVARIITDDGRMCTGTFIDVSWVLTAGHCISPRAEIFGRSVDLNDLEDFGAASGFAHPYYDENESVPRFDFGLYRLDGPATSLPADLPGLISYADTWSWAAGGSVITLGWGITAPEGDLTSILQKATLTVQSDASCESLDRGLGAVFDPTTAICATDTTASACNGDSGGPLLVRHAAGAWKILGVTSYGPENCDGHSVFGWIPAGLAWARSLTGLALGSGTAISGERTVTRIFGLDRFETAAAVGAFWDESDVVFVATGGKFPDALAAGTAAASLGAPVLLVNTGNVPESTRYQIDRLAPSTIYVAGGPLAVSDGVVAELGAIVGSEVIRVGGADRYETADLLGELSDGSRTGGRVWIASGRDFADPLVASTAGAVFDESLVLVDGINPLPERTRQRLLALTPSKIVILGSAGSFANGVRESLAAIAPVQSLTEGDPSWRSAVVWGDLLSSEWVSLATVENFPDALAAVPFSSLDPVSPVMLVPQNCVPVAVRDQILRLGSERLALFGGPAALSESVESLQPC